MGGGRRGGRAFVNLVLSESAQAGSAFRTPSARRGRRPGSVVGRAPASRAATRRRPAVVAPSADRVAGCMRHRAQDARPRRGLDDARRLREPTEARSVDLVVLRDESQSWRGRLLEARRR